MSIAWQQSLFDKTLKVSWVIKSHAASIALAIHTLLQGHDCVQAKLQAQRAQLKESLIAEAMRECTFKPKTNEGHNRELIAKILKAEDESIKADAMD